MADEAAWLAARFDELSKRYPALSLVIVMRPDDIASVPHDVSDEDSYSVHSVIKGPYERQFCGPNPVQVEIPLPGNPKPLKVYQLGAPWHSFPGWNYSGGGIVWERGIWEMWLHRRFGFDPRSADPSEGLVENIECLDAYNVVFEAATALLFNNPKTREQSFLWDGHNADDEKFSIAGPWLLFLTECFHGHRVGFNPEVRVIHDIGIASVRVLKEIMHGQRESLQEKLPNSDDDRSRDASLPDAALKAIVAGGMAGVLTEAAKLPAVERHSQTMMEMLKDKRYYAWVLEDWVVHLGASKKTIQRTPAWGHIMAWREENKREMLSE
jgi:hypothetical protein